VDLVAVPFGVRQQHRPRAVAEEDAGPPVAPVEDLGERVGAYDQDVAVAIGRGEHHGLRRVEGEHEAGADRVHVERRALTLRHAQLLLDEAGDSRLRLVGRRAGDDDEVDVRFVDARMVQAAQGGLAGHVARSFMRRRDAPLEDAGFA